MCSDDIIVDFIAVSQLYLYPPTEWWKHLHEDKLFIPDRFIGSFLYSCSTLEKDATQHLWVKFQHFKKIQILKLAE